jgi:hypothetical protein
MPDDAQITATAARGSLAPQREGISPNRSSRIEPLKKNESLKDRIDEALLKIQNNPKLVRSFFGADSVSYAKD